MGWIYTQKESNISASKYIKDNLLVWNTPNVKYNVLDGGVVKFRTYYGAVQRIDEISGECRVFAVVIMLDYNHRDTYNFGYKDMDESCGPCQAECPERILKLLTPTENEYANEWRKRCMNNIKARKSVPKITPNTVLNYSGKTYTVIRDLGRKGYIVNCENLTYRMKNTQVAKAQIINSQS